MDSNRVYFLKVIIFLLFSLPQIMASENKDITEVKKISTTVHVVKDTTFIKATKATCDFIDDPFFIYWTILFAVASLPDPINPVTHVMNDARVIKQEMEILKQLTQLQCGCYPEQPSFNTSNFNDHMSFNCLISKLNHDLHFFSRETILLFQAYAPCLFGTSVATLLSRYLYNKISSMV